MAEPKRRSGLQPAATTTENVTHSGDDVAKQTGDQEGRTPTGIPDRDMNGNKLNEHNAPIK